MDAVRALLTLLPLSRPSRLPGLPFVPRRFSVSLTFSVLCLFTTELFSLLRGLMMAAIALACFMAQETQRAALSIIYQASLRDDEILRSFSLLSSPFPSLFFFLSLSLHRPAMSGFVLFAGFAESRTARSLRVRYYLPSLSVRDLLEKTGGEEAR